MKNGIKYLVAGLVATGLTVSSYATISATLNAANNSYVTDNTGSLNYLSGDRVELGTFSVAPTVGSPSLANFTVFATALTGTGIGVGSFSATGTIPSAGAFSHTQIYLVVFNNASGVNPSQLAIADVNDAINTAWRFPADADIPNSTTFELDSLFSGTTGAAVAAGQIIYGSVGQDASGPYNLLKTQLVPEPSTWMLVGTGLIGLLGLRRRRS